MQDERKLIRQLRCGNPAALRIIYEHYKEHLTTVAACLLGDRLTAEDVLHDIFVTFAGNAGLGVRNDLKRYLTTCVANRSRDYLRRSVRQNRLHLVPLENAAEAVSPVGDPRAQLIKDEDGQAVYQALTELPYEQREVISLHLNGDMSLGEIARLLGVSINTVKSRYRYGLVKMRSIFRVGACE